VPFKALNKLNLSKSQRQQQENNDAGSAAHLIFEELISKMSAPKQNNLKTGERESARKRGVRQNKQNPCYGNLKAFKGFNQGLKN